MPMHGKRAVARSLVPLDIPTDHLWLASLTRAGYVPLLERLVAGADDEQLHEALELVVQTVEAQDPGVFGSILLLDQESGQLRHGAGLRLPREYRDAIDGSLIGPEAGSCGAAAWHGVRVVVEDIASDPKWLGYREHALKAGLRACWSEPIIENGRVLGTFAMYYAEPRAPTADALLVIDAAAHLARLAIERHRSRQVTAEQQKLQERLWQAQKMESLGILAGGVAHDFNNLLVGVLGSADLVERKLPPFSPVLEDVRRIQSAAVRCSELCKQLLAYSGKGKLVVQVFQLPELIQEMGQLLEVSLSKSIALKYQFTKGLPPIEGDASQLRQVVMNLLTNAAEAIGANSGVITISVGMVEASNTYLREAFGGADLPEGFYVTLQVSDTGCGMDADTVKRIFDPFFTTKFTGRGLGLAAVLGIVRGHGGALRVYSEPGQGSSFKLLLPASGAPAASLSDQAAPEDTFVGHGCVLVVDDEETVRTVAKRLLEMHGFSVLTANDGREAVAVYREYQHEIRVVLLDMMMPHLNGELTYQELRRINPAVSVILSSGYNEQDVTSQFAGKGLKGFVQKPFRHADLLTAFRRALLDQEKTNK